MKSAECFYRTRNARIQYIGDKCRVSVRFSVVGVHCHSLVLLPLAVTEHITVHSAQVESSVSARISSQDQDDASRERTAGSLSTTGKDDKKTRYSASTCARQTTGERIATGQGAASAQAVKRGHQVTMIEVPDKEDNASY